MKTIASILLVLSLTSIVGPAFAQVTTDPSPNNPKGFYDQLDRENRGGQGE